MELKFYKVEGTFQVGKGFAWFISSIVLAESPSEAQGMVWNETAERFGLKHDSWKHKEAFDTVDVSPIKYKTSRLITYQECEERFGHQRLSG
jgi:hypothetical protein